MPTSVVHLTDLNADPLPASLPIDFPGYTIAYGSVVGGDLDTADAASSYIEIYEDTPASIVYVVTARLVADPPIPPGATLNNTFGAIFSSWLAQGRNAGAVSPSVTTRLSPDFITQPFAWVPGIVTFTDMDWHTTADTVPVFGGVNGYLVDDTALFDALTLGGYVVLLPHWGGVTQISQVLGAVEWNEPDLQWHTVGGHFSTVGPAGLKILTPGRGWVDVVDGPA